MQHTQLHLIVRLGVCVCVYGGEGEGGKFYKFHWLNLILGQISPPFHLIMFDFYEDLI